MVKNPPANAGDAGDARDPCVGKIPALGNGNPLQYSCLEVSMARGAWRYSPQGHKQLDMTVDTYKKKKGLGRTRSLAFIEHLLHAECWAQGFIYMIPLGLVRGI